MSVPGGPAGPGGGPPNLNQMFGGNSPFKSMFKNMLAAQHPSAISPGFKRFFATFAKTSGVTFTPMQQAEFMQNLQKFISARIKREAAIRKKQHQKDQRRYKRGG